MLTRVGIVALVSTLFVAPVQAAATYPDELVRLFDRGVALVEQHRHAEAIPVFDEVLRSAPDWNAARVNLAIALLNDQKDLERAERELNKVLESEPENPWANYTLSMLYKHLGESAKAQERLEAVLKADPRSADAHVGLGTLLASEGKLEDAIAHFQEAKLIDPYLIPAHYGLGRALMQAGKTEEGQKELQEFQALRAGHAGKNRALVYTEMGRYSDVIRQTPDGAAAAVTGQSASWSPASTPAGASGTAVTSVAIANVAGDIQPELLVAYGAASPLQLCRRDGTKGLTCADAGVGPGLDVRSADLDHDGRRDLLVRQPAGVQVFWQKTEGRFEAGPQLWDGPTVGAELGDLDADGDLDVLAATADGAAIRWNARDGHFLEEPRTEAKGIPELRGVLLADLDEDGDLDGLLMTGHGGLIWRNGRLGRFSPPELSVPEATGPALWLDGDGDGRQELVFKSPAVALDLGLDGRVDVVEAKDVPGLKDVTAMARGDLDGDGDEDLAIGTGDGPVVVTAATPAGRHWIGLALASEGNQPDLRGNPSGIGAFVEVKAGSLDRRMQVVSGPSDEAVVLGLADRGTVDYVHIEWSDGVVQAELDLAADQRHRVPQVQRKLSSCPVLFSWDGRQFAFITDFLGGGGLGFLVEPGVYGPPDPIERVRIAPEQISPRDGAYELKVAEPMEEITYLDRAELLVVDHPAGTEVHPDERFVTGEPARTSGLWLVRDAVAPRAASDRAGADCLREIRESDRVYAAAGVPDPRFLGFASDASLTLDFGDAAASWSEGAVLLLEGWVEYPYSRVNHAAYQAGLKMRPAALEILEADGSAHTVYPAFGYPAGMPRTMTLPIPASLTRGRNPLVLRLSWGMEIYWDRARLAPQREVPTAWIQRLPVESAELAHAGYMREYSPDGRLPRLYDRGSVERSVTMRDLFGLYTRYGDVTPLLKTTDDAFTIFGRGEELTLRFHAPAAPAPGQLRTCLLEADGYCKDRDPHTAYPETVEPLPYHSMPSYPYPPTSRPPQSELARQFNTRAVGP